MDNSVTFKESSSARVSISDGEFVILVRKKETVFHGHVVSWDELEIAMQDALVDAGFVSSYGKILWKN